MARKGLPLCILTMIMTMGFSVSEISNSPIEQLITSLVITLVKIVERDVSDSVVFSLIHLGWETQPQLSFYLVAIFIKWTVHNFIADSKVVIVDEIDVSESLHCC